MTSDKSARFKESRCDIAAFELNRSAANGVYPERYVTALRLFYLLPCAATAAFVCEQMPALAPIIEGWDDISLAWDRDRREVEPYPIDIYIEEANKRFDRALPIREFVEDRVRTRALSFGFPAAGREDELLKRLTLLGLSPPWLSDKRQWLRSTIPRNADAWFICADLICLHGVADGKEVFFDALGMAETPLAWGASNFLVDLGTCTDEFLQAFVA